MGVCKKIDQRPEALGEPAGDKKASSMSPTMASRRQQEEDGGGSEADH